LSYYRNYIPELDALSNITNNEVDFEVKVFSNYLTVSKIVLKKVTG